MSRKLKVPIHIILGNHDLNLKHSHEISSLDSLGMDAMKLQKISLHRYLEVAEICDKKCVMMPYYEDQNKILQFIDRLSKEKGLKAMSQMIGFAHASINGALRYSKLSRPYEGPVSTKPFSILKRTFSGHFHVHQKLGDRFVYVGSPLQFNFGDAGDERGIVIYDTEKDTYQHVVNPYCHAFRKITDEDIEFAEKNPHLFKDTFVMVHYGTKKSLPEQELIKQRLLKIGALDVRKESVIDKVIKDSKIAVTNSSNNVEDLIVKFVDDVYRTIDTRKKYGKEFENLLKTAKEREELIRKGREFVKAVNKIHTLQQVEKDGAAFDGELSKLVMTDFLGIQGTLELDFSSMKDGIWVLEGDNGSGKSTILEAITWCQFGDFLRSDMIKDFAINTMASQCTVRLEYSNGFVIERSRKRLKPDTVKTFQKSADELKETYLEENEKGELKNTQKAIDNKLGINFQTFCKSIVLGQNIVNNFIAGGKDQRRAIIEETLGLEKFNYYYDEAKAERVSLENEIASITLLKEKLEIHMQEFKSQHADILQHTDYNLRIKEKEAKREELLKLDEISRAQLKAEKSKLLKELNELKELLASQQESRPPEEKRKMTQLVGWFRELSDSLRSSSSVLTSFEETKQCPTCEQPITPTGVNATLYKIIQQLKLTKEELDKANYGHLAGNFPEISELEKMGTVELQNVLNSISDAAENESNRLQAELDNDSYESAGYRNRMAEIDRILLTLENKRLLQENSNQKTLSDIDKQIDVLKSEATQAAKFGDLRRAEYEKMEKTLSDYKAQLAVLNTKYQTVRFWELAFDKKSKSNSGFSSLRAHILETSVKDLNAIFEVYMEKLSSTPLTVTLTPDLELEEKYGMRSGGERKRTDLVTLFAMFELVRQRSRYNAQFIALDEVFDALDKNGQRAVRNVLEMLSDRVKKVFVVTHSDITSGMPIAGTISFEMKRSPAGKPQGTQMQIKEYL